MTRILATVACLCCVPVAGAVAQQPGTLMMRVIDMGTGKAIPGVRVWIGPNPDPAGVPTDADGRWMRTGLPAGKPVTVTYRKPAYINDPQQSSLLPDGALHEVYLRRPDQDPDYYVQISYFIQKLAGLAGARKQEVYASQWAELAALPDDKLNIVGRQLRTLATPTDLRLIPVTTRNARLLYLDAAAADTAAPAPSPKVNAK